jgi:SAM-dependent methyltransferase
MKLSASHWARIHAHQERELATLIADRDSARALSRTVQYSRIGEWLPGESGVRVLELGCGPGKYVAMLHQLGYCVVGVDPVLYPTWEKLRALDRVALVSGVVAERLPFAEGAFDHVVCMAALLYFKDPREAFREVRRVLKPGGRLVVRTVNRANFYTRVTGRKLDPSSLNLYTQEELTEALATAGFEAREAFSHGFWPPCLTDYWWYLINGRISPAVQSVLSSLTPARYRVNVTVFCHRK